MFSKYILTLKLKKKDENSSLNNSGIKDKVIYPVRVFDINAN